MAKTIFKRLAEVQILHDYFLTMVDGASFFENNKEEKNTLLEKRIEQNLYSANTIFDVGPVMTATDKLRQNKLIFAPTPLGFILGCEVEEVFEAGELRYKPVFEIGKKTVLSFFLKPKLPLFLSLTNLSLETHYPSIYYFTNKDKNEFTENTVPSQTSFSLSKEALTPQAGENYEMGTLLDFNGTLKEALQKTDGTNPTHWEDAPERRFVTRADKLFLPHNFRYEFKSGPAVTKAEISLEDTSGNEIKKIVKNSSDAMTSIFLNFSKIDESDPSSAGIPVGIYNIKVKINGGQEIVNQIHLNDELYKKEFFGIVELNFEEANSTFSLLDGQGYLKTRIDATAQKVPHPIFEIRLKNRRSYWRYNKTTAFSAAEINDTSAYLDAPVNNLLIAKKPKGLTASLVPFKNGTNLTLPHPIPLNIRVEQDKIYSEIYINQSNRLLRT